MAKFKSGEAAAIMLDGELPKRERRSVCKPCVLCGVVSDVSLNKHGECGYCVDDAEAKFGGAEAYW